LTILTLAVVHEDRFAGNFIADGGTGAAAGKNFSHGAPFKRELIRH
jgi:hypothetical protein